MRLFPSRGSHLLLFASLGTKCTPRYYRKQRPRVHELTGIFPSASPSFNTSDIHKVLVQLAKWSGLGFPHVRTNPINGYCLNWTIENRVFLLCTRHGSTGELPVSPPPPLLYDVYFTNEVLHALCQIMINRHTHYTRRHHKTETKNSYRKNSVERCNALSCDFN